MADDKVSVRKDSNWTEQEKIVLKEECLKNVEVLRARHSAKVTQQVKNKIWADISKTVSAMGKLRTAEQCRKKWANESSRHTSNVRQFLNGVKATGGGPKPDTPPEESFQVVSALGMDKVVGIPNGPETVVIYELPEDNTTTETASSNIPMEATTATSEDTEPVGTNCDFMELINKIKEDNSVHSSRKRSVTDRDVLKSRNQLILLDMERINKDISRIEEETLLLKDKRQLMSQKIENIKLHNQNLILQNELLQLQIQERKRITEEPVTDSSMLQDIIKPSNIEYDF